MAPRRTGSNDPYTVRGRVATGGPEFSLKSPHHVGEVTTNYNLSLVKKKIQLTMGSWHWCVALVRGLGSWPLD
jgi:hypothetical protein